MKKSILIVCTIFCASIYSTAQNRPFDFVVQVQKGHIGAAGLNNNFFRDFKLSSVNPKTGFSVIGRLGSNISVGATYSFWTFGLAGDPKGLPSEVVGQIFSRGPYKVFDVDGRYNWYYKKHNTYAGLGLSYAGGENVYFDGFWHQPGAFDYLESATDVRQEKYYGGYIMAGYNYALFKERINIGAHAKYRQYTEGYWQYDVNLNLGYNFNLPKLNKGSADKE